MKSDAGPVRDAGAFVDGRSSKSRVQVEGVRVAYPTRTVLDGLDLAIPDQAMTVIVGPNASGKSTLLKTITRIVETSAGSVLVDGQTHTSMTPKELARTIAMLPQSATAPDSMTVAELVSRGRHPWQGLFRQWSPADEAATAAALTRCGLDELAERRVSELSGGQRQRAWIAMSIAQDTPVLFLDEPTTYLDLAHQVDVLELARSLTREGRTVVAVLHELHLAFRYADHLVVLKDGALVAQGDPREVVTVELMRDVYDLDCVLISDPLTGTPIVVPSRGVE